MCACVHAQVRAFGCSVQHSTEMAGLPALALPQSGRALTAKVSRSLGCAGACDNKLAPCDNKPISATRAKHPSIMCLLRHATLHVILGLGVKVPMSAWKLHEPHLNINMYSQPLPISTSCQQIYFANFRPAGYTQHDTGTSHASTERACRTPTDSEQRLAMRDLRDE